MLNGKTVVNINLFFSFETNHGWIFILCETLRNA